MWIQTGREDSIALLIHICHDRWSFDSSRRRALLSKASSIFSSKQEGSGSERSNTKTKMKKVVVENIDEPAIDEVGIRAMVSILNGYIDWLPIQYYGRWLSSPWRLPYVFFRRIMGCHSLHLWRTWMVVMLNNYVS